MTDDDEPKQIEASFVKAAVELVRDYFAPHSRAALQQIGFSDRHADARRVLRWLKAGARTAFSREEVRRQALSRSLDASDRRALHQRQETALLYAPTRHYLIRGLRRRRD